MSYQITKSTVELYKFRNPSGMYWADITIDANGNTGRITIASDFGSWQNYWGACGCSFKEFLAQLNMEYAADKFGADGFFDHRGTLQLYREIILQRRRAESITAEDARQAWIECKRLDDCNDKGSFTAEMWHNDTLMRMFDNMPEMCERVSPQFTRFWNEIWPLLLFEFQREHAESITT